jgi:stringent starvation protein B
MPETSTKPYLLRALYEWCTDNGYSPFIVVKVDSATKVPMEFVKNGEIVLNISFGATGQLKMDNDYIHFKARFGGISREIEVPIENVSAIYARENGQGMAFEVTKEEGNARKKKNTGKSIGTIKPRIENSPALSAVPVSGSPAKEEQGNFPGTDEDPEPPKKSRPPTLTRIK